MECGVGQGDETVSVWRDFAQFYERMEHHILQANAETFGFPLSVLRVAVSALQNAACVSSMVRQPPLEYPSRGVVAGCAIVTYLVKLYCLPVLDSVVRLHPRVSLDVFIDDSHQSAQGTPREARKLIVAAGRTFTEEAQKQLRVRFADKKTAIVSSHRKLALSVARQLGCRRRQSKPKQSAWGSM